MIGGLVGEGSVADRLRCDDCIAYDAAAVLLEAAVLAGAGAWCINVGSKNPGRDEPAFGELWAERGCWCGESFRVGVGGEVGTSLMVEVDELGYTVKPELTVRASEWCDDVDDAEEVEGVRLCCPNIGGGGSSGGFSGDRRGRWLCIAFGLLVC